VYNAFDQFRVGQRKLISFNTISTGLVAGDWGGGIYANVSL